MTTHHILIVTGTYDPIDDVDNRDYELECPGVTDRCRAYFECDCPESKPDDKWDGDTWFDWTGKTVVHGVEHQHIDAMWMAATDRCLYVDHGQMPDCADWLNLVAGRYLVDVSYKGDGDINMELLKAEVTP